MPKLSKILSFGKKKSDDAVSVASGASNVSKRSSRSLKSSKSRLSRGAAASEEEPTGLQICGYVVRKEKDLPKLHKHCWKGEVAKMEEDVRKGVDVNGLDKGGRSGLHLAAARGHCSVVDVLISKGANLEVRDSQVRTPLMKAADSGHIDVVRCLLTNGADPDAFDASGLTSLHVAVHRREMALVEELVQASASTKKKNNLGFHPLHIAAIQGSVEMVRLLVGKGANVDAADNEGKTPLILAAQNGLTNAVKALLECRADPSIRAQGKTALDFATKNAHLECAKVLQSYKGSSPARLPLTTSGTGSLRGSSFFGGPALDQGTEEDEEDTASVASERKDNMSWSSNEDSSSTAPVATLPHAQKASLSAVLRLPTSSLDTGGQGGSGSSPAAQGPLPKVHSDVGGTGSRPEAQPPTSPGVLPGSSRNLRMADLGIGLSAGFQSEEEEEEEDDSVELQVAQLATKPPPLPTTLSSPPPPSSSIAPKHPMVEREGSGDGSVEKELGLPSDHDEDIVTPPLSPTEREAVTPSHVGAHSAKHSSDIGGQVPRLKPKMDIDEDFDSTDSEAELPKPQSELQGQIKAEPASHQQQCPPREEEWSEASEGEDEEAFLAASGRKASKYFEGDTGSGNEQLVQHQQKLSFGMESSKDLAAEMFGLPDAQLGGEEEEEESDFDSDIDLPEGGEGGYVPSAFGGDSQQRSSTALAEEGGVGQTPPGGGKSLPPILVSPPVHSGGANTPSSSLLSPTSLTQTVMVTPLTIATDTPLVLDHQERDITMATQPAPPEVKVGLDFGSEEVGSGGAVNVPVPELEEKESEEVVEEVEESDWDSEREEEEEEGLGTALGGLGSSGLPDPFTSPPSRKEDATPTPVSSSRHLNYFSAFKSDSEGEEEAGRDRPPEGEEEAGRDQPPPVLTQDTSGGEAQDMGGSSSSAKPSRVRQIFSDITGSLKPTAPQPDAAADREGIGGSSEEDEEKEEEEEDEKKVVEEAKQAAKGVELQQGSTDEEEEEEESEWEVVRRASRQSLSPSHAKSPLPDLPSITRLSPLPPLQPRGASPAKSTEEPPGDLGQTAEKHVLSSMEAGGKPSPELAGSAPSHPGVSPSTEKQKMDAEASARLHNKQSELLRVLQRRREHVDVAQSSPDTRKPVAMEADRPTPRSASVTVSQMKSVWEGQFNKHHSHPQLSASKSDSPIQPPPQPTLEEGGAQKEDLPSSHASKMTNSRETPLTTDILSNVPRPSAPQLGLPSQSHSHPTLTQDPVTQTNDTHVASQLPSNEQGHVQPASDDDVSIPDGSNGATSSGEEEDSLGAVAETGAERGLPLSLKDLRAEVSPSKGQPSPARRQPVSPVHSAVRYTLDTDTPDLSPDNTTDDFSVSDKVKPHQGGYSRDGVVGVSPGAPDLPPCPPSQLSMQTGSPIPDQESSCVAQLRKELRESRRKLDRAETERDSLDSKRKLIEEQLTHSKKHAAALSASKSELERVKLDLELDVRTLKHKLELGSDENSSMEACVSQLKGRIQSLEEEVKSERKNKYAMELKNREFEIEQQALKSTNQQLQGRVSELLEQLSKEKEAKEQQGGVLSQQLKSLQQMEEDRRLTLNQKEEFQAQLEEFDASHRDMSAKVSALQREVNDLQSQLREEHSRHEADMDQLERESDTLKDSLLEKNSALAAMERDLRNARQQYEATLTELQAKAGVLSATCDREAAARQQLESEVAGLAGKLEQSHCKIDELVKQNMELEKCGHASRADWASEKSKMEKELELSQNREQSNAERLSANQKKSHDLDSEVRSLQSLVTEKTNCLTLLQRELDHKQASLVAAQEKMEALTERTNTTISNLQAESSRNKDEFESRQLEAKMQLQGVELALQEANREKEEMVRQAEQLRENVEKLQDQARSLDGVLAEDKKVTASLQAEKSVLEAKCDHLAGRVVQVERERAQVEAQLRELTLQHASLDRQHAAVEVKNDHLGDRLREVVENSEDVKRRTGELERKLASVESMRNEALEKLEEMGQTVEQTKLSKHEVEVELQEARLRLSESKQSLQFAQQQVEGLKEQLQQAIQSRMSLEKSASQYHREAMELQLQLDEVSHKCEDAERRAEEAKTLWDMEAKTRTQLGLKMKDMETSQSSVNSLVDAEKRKVRKALDQQRKAEAQLQVEAERVAGLQQEVASLRAKVKGTKEKARSYEGQVAGMASMQAELEQQQHAMRSELRSVKAELSSTEEQLKRQTELRTEAELLSKSLQHEVENTNKKLSSSHSAKLDKERERQKLERANRKLRQELEDYKTHVAESYLERSEVEAMKQHIESKAHIELQKKLEQVNSHLEEQASTQLAMDSMRQASETEWKARYSRDTEALKTQLSQLRSSMDASRLEKERSEVEAKRFKTLFEEEARKAQRLTSRLDRAKERTANARTELTLERNRERLLADSTLSRAAKLGEFGHVTPHASHVTPAPYLPTPTSRHPLSASGRHDEEYGDTLLHSVRRELDQSIAKHLDPALGITPLQKWERTGSSSRQSKPPASGDPHLNSIVHGYKL